MNIRSRWLAIGPLLGAFLLAALGGALAQQPGIIGSGQVLGNSTAAQRTPTAATLTALFDRAYCSGAGSVLYRGASAWACLAGTATARQMLQSGTSAAPTWSTATWPATTTANQLLYSSAANTVGEIATAANGLLVTNNSSVPSILAGPGASGRIPQSQAAGAPAWSTAGYPGTAGTGGTFLRSDGTNWVSSGTTIPDTGTSGGVLCYTGSGVLASSSALTANGVVYGGGAGVCPAATAGGTTGTMLIGTTGSAPSFSSSGALSTQLSTPLVTSSGTLTLNAASTAVIMQIGASETARFTSTTPNFRLGVPGAATGSMDFAGATSNVARVTAQAAAGNPTLTLPTTTGTLVSSAAAPLSINATTGVISHGNGTSWTPTLRFGGATTGITYTSQTGRYYQFGNMICFSAYILTSSKGSASGLADIDGLPVAANFVGTAAMMSSTGLTGVAGHFDAWVNGGATTIRLAQNNAGTHSQWTDANFSAATDIGLSGCYFTS